MATISEPDSDGETQTSCDGRSRLCPKTGPDAFLLSDPLLGQSQRSLLHRIFGSGAPAIRLWFFTNLIVWTGASLGFYFVPLYTDAWEKPETLAYAMSNWDGDWFRRIVEDGYEFSPDGQSSVAFFPGYPCVAWVGCLLTRFPTEVVLPLVSLIAFLGSIVLFQLYLESGNRQGNTQDHGSASRLSLLALCIWPTSFYLRMGYSESLFLLLSLLAFTGIRRNWPLWLIAFIVGATTGVRSVGLALLLPLAWTIWERSASSRQLIQRTVLLGPLSCWGLFAFMIHLQVQFGNPLAFVEAQQHWKSFFKNTSTSISPLRGLENLLSLVTLEPVWNVYNPWSSTAWYKTDGMPVPLLSLQFWNPIYFLLCASLIVYGARKRWLTPPEWLLSAGLLGIPYVLQAQRLGMLSHGRFTCVVFPMFIVLGRLMSRWPVGRQYSVLSLMAVQVFYWSALFASSYCIW